jgi:hypothetical protein
MGGAAADESGQDGRQQAHKVSSAATRGTRAVAGFNLE